MQSVEAVEADSSFIARVDKKYGVIKVNIPSAMSKGMVSVGKIVMLDAIAFGSSVHSDISSINAKL